MNNPDRRQRPGLIAARSRRGLTQEAAAEEAGVSATTWARWEQGKQGIRLHSRTRLTEMFGVPLSEVDRWADGQQAEPVVPWLSEEAGFSSLADTVESCGELWRWDVDPARRRLLGTMPFVPAVLSEWLLSWNLDPVDELRGRVGPGTSVGMEDVRRIREATQAFSQMDEQFGGGLVRPAVVDYLNTKVAPLLEGRYSEEVGEHLASAAALMTELAGWEAYDTGSHGLAQIHYGHALQLSKTARDNLTAARILSSLAQQACDLKHPQWAVRLASAAHQAGHDAQAPPRVMAHLLLQEARAAATAITLADTRDVHGEARVHRLIGDAETTFAQAAPGDHEPTWISYFTQPEFIACAGLCWQMIGEYPRAAQCADQAVHGLNPRFPRAIQLNTVHLATARLGMGDLDYALAAAKDAVPMANALTSRRSVEWVRDFDTRLAPHADEPQVKDWRDFMRSELGTQRVREA
ncbi:helix-turn-helix transcriptional regulator [Actinomadura soli]|uniref:Helix-turn-helix transcriptional regulator n=1 Tax=Actinomadura soli TaxID=2508997 RepID=A0A5C4J5J8_9ACTN|nr:helix-turn-helix transcriptional regulator [Actinomadura soli]TMQ90991.1 helix-turn-helix transcriptional regulator [Actinomadura soli]